MPDKRSRMEHALNWKDEISVIAGPFEGNRKSWLARAARRAAVSYRQVRALYYGESTNPRHETAASIIEAANEARLREARRDAQQVAGLYRQYAETLAATDPNSNRSEIDALLTAARILGGGNSA